jgi:hypothetical protein
MVHILHPSARFTAITTGRHKHQIGNAHISVTRKTGRINHSLANPTPFMKRLRSRLKRPMASSRQTNHKPMRHQTLTTRRSADSGTLHLVIEIRNQSIAFPGISSTLA